MHRFPILILTFVVICLAACSTQESETIQTIKRMPLPGIPIDPSDAVLKQAIARTIQDRNAPRMSSYDFHRIDLDGDTRRDALVLMKSPYGYWCSQHGCALFVMKASDTDFTMTSAIKPVRPPVYLGNNSTNGWRNLIVRLSGRTEKAKNVVLKHDGASYPANPELSKTTLDKKNITTQARFFYDVTTP